MRVAIPCSQKARSTTARLPTAGRVLLGRSLEMKQRDGLSPTYVCPPGGGAGPSKAGASDQTEFPFAILPLPPNEERTFRRFLYASNILGCFSVAVKSRSVRTVGHARG